MGLESINFGTQKLNSHKIDQKKGKSRFDLVI
jgi:hypothetical protein